MYIEKKIEDFEILKKEQALRDYLLNLISKLTLVSEFEKNENSFLLHDKINEVMYNLVIEDDEVSLIPDVESFSLEQDIVTLNVSTVTKIAKMSEGIFSFIKHDSKVNRFCGYAFDEEQSAKVCNSNIDPSYVKHIDYKLEKNEIYPFQKTKIFEKYDLLLDQNSVVVMNDNNLIETFDRTEDVFGIYNKFYNDDEVCAKKLIKK